MVRIVHESGAQSLPWEKVKEYFPPVVEKISQSQGFDSPSAPSVAGEILCVAEAYGALQSIDPDIAYEKWLEIGMSLHHECDGGQEGFKLWDEWSEKGRSYKERECAYRWETFNTHADRNKVTLKTLFKLARDQGWDGNLADDPKGIELAKIQRRRQLEDFDRYHGLAMVEGRALVVYRERNANMDQMTTVFASPKDLSTFYKNKRIPKITESGQKKISLTTEEIVPVWLSMTSRRTYSQLMFHPHPDMVAGAREMPDTEEYNLYQGLAIRPHPGDCTLILQHIREVWCSGNLDDYEYVLNWLARMFQEPQTQGKTVIVLSSGEGAGKNIIVDALVSAFGKHAFTCTRSEDLTGKFNDHLGTSVLVFANEAIWGGDKALEGALKAMVTDPILPIEKKYLPKFTVRNCTHLIVASNNDWVVPVGWDDRRFVFLELSGHRVGDSTYFKALAHQIDNGGLEAFVHFLLRERNIAGFDPQHIPESVRSSAKFDNKIRTTDSVTQWWVAMLQQGQIVQTDIWGEQRPGGITPNWINSEVILGRKVLYGAYQEWARNMVRHVEHLNSFGKTLKKLLPSLKIARPREEESNKRQRGYVFPPLAECRKELEKSVRQKLDWGDDGNGDSDDASNTSVETWTNLDQGQKPGPRQRTVN